MITENRTSGCRPRVCSKTGHVAKYRINNKGIGKPLRRSLPVPLFVVIFNRDKENLPKESIPYISIIDGINYYPI